VPQQGVADPSTGHPATASWAFVVLFGHAIGEGDRLAALPTADDPIMRGAGFTFEELLPTIRDLLTSGIVPVLNTDLDSSRFYINAAFQNRLMDALRNMGRLEPLEAWIGLLVCGSALCLLLLALACSCTQQKSAHTLPHLHTCRPRPSSSGCRTSRPWCRRPWRSWWRNS